MNWIRRTGWCIALALAAGGAGPASGPATRVGPPPKPPIDPSSINTEAESVTIELRQARAAAAAEHTPQRVQDELPALSDEIKARLDETGDLLQGRPSLQVLDAEADYWQVVDRQLEGWHRSLDRRKQVLQDETNPVPTMPKGRLEVLDGQWAETGRFIDYWAAHPVGDGMRQRMFDDQQVIDDTRQEIVEAQNDIRAQVSTTYAALAAIDLQQARVTDVVESVREARDQAWDRLFQRDGVPVWLLRPAPRDTAKTPAGDGRPGAFAKQRQAVWAYVQGHRTNVGLHVALIAALAAVLMVARRWVRRWAEADPSLKRATLAFTAPIATALVLSFFAAVWIYPQAPRLFWAGLGGAALVPTVYLLRRVVERRLFVILDALVVSYAADQVRQVAAGFPLVARGLFLGEMLGGAVVLVLLIRARRDHVPADVMGWVVHVGVRLWLATFALCLVSDAVGFVSLAELAGGAALGGAYLAVILYACTRVVGGLVVILLRSRPLSLLNGVRRHQPLLLRRLTGAVDWVAAGFWATGVLAMLSARPWVFAAGAWFWHKPVGLGAIEFTPSHVLVFGLTVWASFLVSRFVRFVLDEDVYAHLHLAGGLSYAINRIVHYAVVVAGFYVAVAAVGVPLTQLSLLVGALTVGLGFGLQNVVNNFVSGLILLFERPIKVGDLIQMSDATAGTVTYIGIRASIIRTPESSEVIVPNGNLISNQLTNWTRTSRERGMLIAVSLSADAEPAAVMRLLTDVAAAHPLVVTQPRPTALLTQFGADAFNYELRAWTNSADQWAQVRSDLSVSLHAALVQAGIGIK